MKKFKMPVIKKVEFAMRDVIVTSGTNGGCGTSYAGGYDKCTSGRSPSE